MYYHEEQVKAILDALKATSDKVNECLAELKKELGLEEK